MDEKTRKKLDEISKNAVELRERLKDGLASLDESLNRINNENFFEQNRGESPKLSKEEKESLLDDFLEELKYERGRRVKRRLGKQVRHDRSRHADY